MDLGLVAPGAGGVTSRRGPGLSTSMYFTYAEQNRSFQSVGVWTSRAVTITGPGEPEQATRERHQRWIAADACRPAGDRTAVYSSRSGPWRERNGSAERRLLAAPIWRRPVGDRPKDSSRRRFEIILRSVSVIGAVGLKPSAG